MVHLCHLKVLKKNSELRQITYIGCVQAIKSYIRKTEITVEGNNSADLIKTLKTIYNQQKAHAFIMRYLRRIYLDLTVVTSEKLS